MKVIIQRVSHASVSVNQSTVGAIKTGLLLLVGFEAEDNTEDYEWIGNKIINLRIFNDSNGIMNLSCKEINGGLLVVSQFTLHASTKKGNRPSYLLASPPTVAKKQYETFIDRLKQLAHEMKVEQGIFGADMKVELLNDGPVTIVLDSKNKV
ncbi:MAG: D-aminoacyl-tRNA deacylase [Bacteroidia bacterium]|jgi:D-tyrosyl-tRNA(Tyr) deacylase|nr:D-aminoacyl-tRNA deacylase [Bacteroidia bacterium]